VGIKKAMDQERVRRHFHQQTSRAFVLPGASWGFTVARDGQVIRVDDVCLDSAAERAGLRSGDAVVEVGRERVHGTREMARAIGGIPRGNPLDLTVSRDGEMMRVRIVRH
jgi:S1-C subfamily serine protease